MPSQPESSGWSRFLQTPPDESEPSSASIPPGQCVLVTGAAGYIGSALVKTIAAAQPRCIVLLDSSEKHLAAIDTWLECTFGDVPRSAVCGSIDDPELLAAIFTRFRPEIVYHAAAFKHVPLLERNPVAGVRNNAIGTYVMAQAALRHGASQFVLVSTDKAVNPHSIMGVSKRIAELATVAMSRPACRMNAIRLANVIGSPGSVVPLFQDQISRRGPVTVTHPDATRWFLSLREAVDAILECGNAECEGRILVPEFGEPVRIAELAGFLISSQDLRDIPITFTGLRAGDKLTEETTAATEIEEETAEGLRVIRTRKMAYADLENVMEKLADRIADNDVAGLIREVSCAVPEYVPSELLRGLLPGLQPGFQR